MAGGKALMNLLTDETSVVATASDYLPWAVLIPFAGLSAFIWDGVFIWTHGHTLYAPVHVGRHPDFFQRLSQPLSYMAKPRTLAGFSPLFIRARPHATLAI